MSKLRGVLVAKVLFAMAAVAIGLFAVEALTSGVVPQAQAVCIAPNNCTPASPVVTCSNGVTYANICVANAACQYTCCPGYVPPNPRFPCMEQQ